MKLLIFAVADSDGAQRLDTNLDASSYLNKLFQSKSLRYVKTLLPGVRYGSNIFIPECSRQSNGPVRITRVRLNTANGYQKKNWTEDQPSGGLIEELRNASLSGNKKRLTVNVRETEDAESAHSLQTLAHKYKYDALFSYQEEACCR